MEWWPPEKDPHRYLQAPEKNAPEVLARFPQIAQALRDDEAMGNQLQPHTQSFFLPAQRSPVRGALVYFHGFSSGTWQFYGFAERLAAIGFHVYVPRLEGHGFQDAQGRPEQSHLPGRGQWRRYATYTARTYEQLRELNPRESGGGGLEVRVSDDI
jgi:alpha-beta hydrolase superfamily lysophospholipase